MSVSLYFGVPESGKTSYALDRVRREIVETRRPAIILDSEQARNLAHIPRAASRLDAFKAAAEGKSTRYVPSGEDDVDRFTVAVRTYQNCIYVIDEFGYWANAHSILPSVKQIIRGHRHRGISLHATTQYPGDLAPLVFQCADHLYVFRCKNINALKRLEDAYRLPREVVEALPPGTCLHVEKWTPPGQYEVIKYF